jgi:polycomb protein EED
MTLVQEPPEKLIPADKICVAWVLGHSALSEPLVVISRGSLLYIYNPESTGMAGYLRGHGGVSLISIFLAGGHSYLLDIRL